MADEQFLGKLFPMPVDCGFLQASGQIGFLRWKGARSAQGVAGRFQTHRRFEAG